MKWRDRLQRVELQLVDAKTGVTVATFPNQATARMWDMLMGVLSWK